ncbi:MAG: hypothetical protein RL220_598 [Bacteroidota bacterium]
MKVLIVNFDFPPNQGIGGRRWAKLAKGLAARGVEVFVIKADPVKFNVESPWYSDVLSPNIHIHSLPRLYPESVSHPRSGVLSKLRYIADMQGLRKYKEGTIYDIALRWEKMFLQKATQLISSESIIHVAATGAPFNLLYYTAKLRDLFPGLRILADYRDPWLTARNYGMPSLSPDMFEKERQKQQLVFDLADVITAPYPKLLEIMMHEDVRRNEHHTKFKLLPHFFDETDIPSERPKPLDNKIKLVYGGALYMDSEESLNHLATAMLKNPSIGDREIEVSIYTDSRIPDSELFGMKNVKVRKGIGKAIFSEIRNADLCLLFMATHNCHFLTTKIMEYLPLRTPFLYLGPKGEVANFIVGNRLGYCPENLLIEWPAIMRQVDEGNPGFNLNYDYGQHSLNAVSQRLLDIF